MRPLLPSRAYPHRERLSTSQASQHSKLSTLSYNASLMYRSCSRIELLEGRQSCNEHKKPRKRRLQLNDQSKLLLATMHHTKDESMQSCATDGSSSGVDETSPEPSGFERSTHSASRIFCPCWFNKYVLTSMCTLSLSSVQCYLSTQTRSDPRRGSSPTGETKTFNSKTKEEALESRQCCKLEKAWFRPTSTFLSIGCCKELWRSLQSMTAVCRSRKRFHKTRVGWQDDARWWCGVEWRVFKLGYTGASYLPPLGLSGISWGVINMVTILDCR